MAAAASAAHYRITGSIWGEELTSDRPSTSPGGDPMTHRINTSRAGRTTMPQGIPEEFHIGTPELHGQASVETDGAAQDIWAGAWREAIRTDVTDLWATDSTSLMPVRSRSSAASANLPVVRRDLEAVEDFCSRLEARQLTHIKVHSERIMEVIAKPIESKLSLLEAKQPQLEWQLTDLSGTMRALGEQVQLQRRASDAVEAALVRWRKQLESEARARYEELRQEFLKASEVLRQEHRSLQETLMKIQSSKMQERALPPAGVEWVTQQELAELRQEIRLLVDGVSVEKPGITRHELNSTIELLKQELRLEMRHFADAALHGDHSTGDVQRDLDSVREEIVSLKASHALSGGRGGAEVEPIIHMATERAERAAERAAEKATSTTVETIMEELRVRGNAISDSATLEIQRNVHKLEAEFDRWQRAVDITTQTARALPEPVEPQVSVREIASVRDSAEQSNQEVIKVKSMVSSVVQSTAAAMAEYDRKANDLCADVASLGSFASQLSLRLESIEQALLGLRGQGPTPAAEEAGAPGVQSLTKIEEAFGQDRSTLVELQKTEQQLLQVETRVHEEQVMKLQQETVQLKATSEARLETLMAEKDALHAEMSTRREEPPHAAEESHHSEGLLAKAKHSLAHMLHLDGEKQDSAVHAGNPSRMPPPMRELLPGRPPEPEKAAADSAPGSNGNEKRAEEPLLSMGGLLAATTFAGKMKLHAKAAHETEASRDLAKKSIGNAISAHAELLEKDPAAESSACPAAPATKEEEHISMGGLLAAARFAEKATMLAHAAEEAKAAANAAPAPVEAAPAPAPTAAPHAEEAPRGSFLGSMKHGLAHMLHLDGEKQEEAHPAMAEPRSATEDLHPAKEPEHPKEELHPAKEEVKAEPAKEDLHPAKEEPHPAEEPHRASLLGSFKHGLAHMMHLDGEKQDATAKEPDSSHPPEEAPTESSKTVRLAPECATEETNVVRRLDRKGTGFVRLGELPPEDEEEESSPQAASVEVSQAAPVEASAMVTCVCGHVLEADDIFCLRCGTKRPVREALQTSSSVTTRSLISEEFIEVTSSTQVEVSSTQVTSTQVEAGGWDELANAVVPRRLLGGLNRDLSAGDAEAASPAEEPDDAIGPRESTSSRVSLFSRMDLNKDGVINREELENALRAGVIYQPESRASPKRQGSPAATVSSPAIFNIAAEDGNAEEAEENFNSCSDEEPSQTSPGLVSSFFRRVSRRSS